MFHVPLPLLEKILRPILVYLALILLLRLFGKRELAQLNPFDLVLLLMLSNTVQNAIIGDDNSLSGGIVGAVALLLTNFLLNRLLFHFPKLDRALQGEQTVLVRDGAVDAKAMKQEMLTREELIQVIHRQNITGLADVRLCVLEPNGTFYVESTPDSVPRLRHEELMKRLDAMQRELSELRSNGPSRDSDQATA
ncbi:DUF421 domain-containing protein [Terriglobus aquaticus]|uniref:DUF421 domain-containing protein n=2 Tax=Terriglobus aquaticus TaxID=940139 RepID=A0ABW9KPK3_9BACT